MAIFEVTITGSSVVYEEDCETTAYLEEESFIFTQEGRDLIDTMMAVQSKLDVLNDLLKKKYPDAFKDDVDWEFKVEGIRKTDCIRFGDTWIKEYVEQGIVVRNYNEGEI